MTARKPTSERVSITLKQVHENQLAQGDSIRDLADAVKDGFHKINSKLDLQIQESGQVKEKVADHETRIRGVEKMSFKTLGFGSAIGGLVSVFGVFIANALNLTK